ncbi:MAG: T9SS type A sorting domain-containing protein [Bacteroidetes bacterium]|nr:T9SS type A sorting domain-containing protein [Bacteroidota bacterium]
MNKKYTIILAGTLLAGAAQAQTLLSSGFDDFGAMLSNGWMQQNNSSPLGTTQWAQGDGGLGVDAGHSGDATSYISDTFTATTDSETGTISDWVISPAVTLENGDSISLWTISFNSATFADRVECRISPNGGSDVGSSETSVGDFTTLVFSINAGLTTTGYPSIQVNGDTWTRFGGEVSGLSGPTSCRVAVRYFIEDGGGAGSNGSTVGIDDIEVFRGATTSGVNELSIAQVSMAPNPANDRVTIRATNGTYDVNVYTMNGQRVMADRFSNATILGIAGLDAGVYMVELRDVHTGAISRQQLVKQ